MPGEQRRTLDAPSQQPVTEIVVKTPQPIEVESMLIDPHDLHDFRLADGAMPGKEALVYQSQPIVRPRLTVGCAAVRGCACRTHPDYHRSAPDVPGFVRDARWGVHLVPGVDAAQDGVGLSGGDPIHRITVTAISRAFAFISQIVLETMASVRPP